MDKEAIREKLSRSLGYKSPEQLQSMMGFIGSINRQGEVKIEAKWWPEKDYLIGLLREGGNGVHRMAVLFPDKSFYTFG